MNEVLWDGGSCFSSFHPLPFPAEMTDWESDTLKALSPNSGCERCARSPQPTYSPGLGKDRSAVPGTWKRKQKRVQRARQGKVSMRRQSASSGVRKRGLPSPADSSPAASTAGGGHTHAHLGSAGSRSGRSVGVQRPPARPPHRPGALTL
jgi:hypothetical protein